MNYLEITENFAKWINRENGEMDDIIARQIIESQFELETYHPFWFLIKEVTINIVSGMSEVVIPNYVIQIMNARIESGTQRSKFIIVNEDRFVNDNPVVGQTGMPVSGVLHGNVLHFDCTSDDSYTLRLFIWRHLDDLDGGTAENIWTQIYTRALRFKTLIDLSSFINDDEKINTWNAQFSSAIETMKKESNCKAFSVDSFEYSDDQNVWHED